VARSNLLPRLFFVARDGQILHHIAQALTEGQDGPECRYLYGSRQAWFFPALERWDTEHAMGWLRIPGHSAAPGHLLQKLHLEPGDLRGLDGAPGPQDPFWTRQADEQGLRRLSALLASPRFAALAEARAKELRVTALAYFRQEGLLDAPEATLVDVGWTLKSQRALRELLRHERPDADVSGYYFGVQAAHAPASELGRARAYFQEQPRHLDPAQRLNHLFRNANIIEQVFTGADHGQLVRYEFADGAARPVLRRPPPAERAAMVRLIRDCAVRFARRAVDAGLPKWPQDETRDWAGLALRRFLSEPPERLVRAVADLRVFDDQNESRSRRLTRPIGPLELLALRVGLVRPPGASYGRSFDWLEGAIALSRPWMRPLLRSPKVFERLRAYRISL